MGAGMLLTIPCSLPSVVGNGMPDATWIPEARLTPYKLSNSPGAIPAVKGAELPAFTMPVGSRNTPVVLKLLLMLGACSATLIPRYLDCLRQAIAARGVPVRLYIDNAKIYRSQQLARIAASLGTLIVHTPPYQPEGRGKIERYFRTVRDQFLTNLDPKQSLSLEALNDRLWTWIEHAYHRAEHSALGSTPLLRWQRDIEHVRQLPPATDLRRLFFYRLDLLLGVHRDHRLARRQGHGGLRIQIVELGIPIGMVATLQHLAWRLQAILELLQQPRHGPIRDLMTLRLERRRQLAGALARPAQGRHGIATRRRLDQRFQIPQQRRVMHLAGHAPTTAPSAAFAVRHRRVQCSERRVHGRARDLRCAGHLGHAAMSERTGLRRKHQPTLAFIQLRQNRRQLARQDHLLIHPCSIADYPFCSGYSGTGPKHVIISLACFCCVPASGGKAWETNDYLLSTALFQKSWPSGKIWATS